MSQLTSWLDCRAGDVLVLNVGFQGFGFQLAAVAAELGDIRCKKAERRFTPSWLHSEIVWIHMIYFTV